MSTLAWRVGVWRAKVWRVRVWAGMNYGASRAHKNRIRRKRKGHK